MDIKELLESDEGKEAIKAAATAAAEEATKGLKSKNEELLGKLKKEKEDRDELQKKIDEAEEAKAKAEEEAVLKSGDIEKITKQMEEKYNKLLDEKDTVLSETQTRLNKEVIDKGLTDALTQAGVAPQFIEDLRIAIKAKHKGEVTADGATLDGKPITDYVSEWSQSDQGKHYLSAPENGGGGAQGANGGGKASTVKADLTGDRSARVAALKQKFPDLQQKGN